jgi:hypothetical protein
MAKFRWAEIAARTARAHFAGENQRADKLKFELQRRYEN